MDHLLKYSTTSEIDVTELHPCPGTVVVGTNHSDYKMAWCDYGEDTEYLIRTDSSENIKVSKPHEVGDICYWTGSELAYVPYTEWNSGLGQAIAVCVVPTKHVIAWGGEIIRQGL